MRDAFAGASEARRFRRGSGTLLLTEAAKKKRASLHVARDEVGLRPFQREGIDTFGCSLAQFRAALTDENHTVKRTLTDPHVFDGIGGTYADEIMHRARVSPVKWNSHLTDEEVARLHTATPEVLGEWVHRLRTQRGEGFPEKVTAFREGSLARSAALRSSASATPRTRRTTVRSVRPAVSCSRTGVCLDLERIREKSIAPKESGLTITLYGISTCDRCRKAKKWLTAQGHEFAWVDIRKNPPSRKQVGGWVDTLGAKALRNTSGSSYRALGPEKKEWSDSRWKRSFADDPMLIKRPVLQVGGIAVRCGFEPDDWKNMLQER